MAGTYTRTKRTVFGDLQVFYYDVTNFTDSETLTVAGMRKIEFITPQVNVASASVGFTISGNVITFKCAADTYDGKLKIEGK